MPPTERRGRVHTSTVTVAVLERGVSVDGPWTDRSEAAFQVEWYSGQGAGGQHRNKHQNCCRLRHLPTGLVESQQGRNRIDNQRNARRALDERLDAMAGGAAYEARSADRKSQVGSGQRGDKARTIRFQADEAVDHETGRRMRASDYMAGFMDGLWREEP